MIASFCFFLGLFVLIGLSSSFQSRKTKQDYYLASSDISPSLVGLSAVATNNSGYMFIGVIGYTYVTGLASVWLMTGWILGDLMASFLVHGRLRRAAGETGEASYVGVLSHWSGVEFQAWQKLGAVVSLVFLLAYAGAQLVAGSKALMVLFHWPAWAGAVMGAVMVAMYCFAGGIRASIWTDAAQSVVMICAMGLLLWVGTGSLGGVDAALVKMRAVEGFMDWYPEDILLPGIAGGLFFALSWLFAGLSVIGQPHVMVRFMTLNSTSRILQARAWYYLWFTAFYAMATGVGMLSRVYLDPAGFDAELALPMMAQELLPPVLVGLVLAGIFAATMSTADSLVLSCSAALTHDLLPHRIENTWLLKLATIMITAVALGWALLNQQSVFSLVVMSWSALASSFAPLLLVWCLGGRPTQALAIAMTITGLAVAIGWRVLGWQAAVYEGMPGIIAGLSIYILGVMSLGLKRRPHGSGRRSVHGRIDSDSRQD